jgi:hypothetical protein
MSNNRGGHCDNDWLSVSPNELLSISRRVTDSPHVYRTPISGCDVRANSESRSCVQLDPHSVGILLP